ncbi:hypothetical protein GX51_08316 [Blastomyces parvus]|uniref:Uncharacterized protein n=1 Tax=Blastomyces parvus TaxID=2060905 RepID=A0A2B7WEY3_9EURO|nr:hypothetical protein GX51_08316 [Blastomyces parvus]
MRLSNTTHWAILCTACCASRSLAQQATPTISPTPIPSYSGCPVEGPLLPRPTNLSQSKHIKAATEKLKTALDSAIAGDTKAGWDVKNVSFSLAFVSPNGHNDGDGRSRPLWEYHHLAEGNVNGTKIVDGDSQYLIGSISKVFSNLILMKSGINLEDPITKYLPELKSKTSPIRWENITLASLGEHLSGIPPNYNGFEFYFLAPLYEQLGFPHLDKDDYDICGVAGLNKACTKEQLLAGMLDIAPITVPFTRPVYSQLSYSLFILAVGEATGKTYDQLLDEMIIQPMGMNNTGASPGTDAKAVIPPGLHSWGADFGLNAPGGGLFSSTNDLAILANSILQKTILTNPDHVRRWLKPKSMSSSRFMLVGDPWEIQRTTTLIPDHPHTIDIYGKSGGSNGYTSQLSIVDQYGVGFVVLTAGPPGSVSILNEAMIGSLMPAIEQETRDQAQKYMGTFTSTSDSSSEHAKRQSDAPITLSLSMDDKPGLKLDALTRNGSSITDAIVGIFSQALPMIGILSTDFRLHPSEYEVPVPANNNDVYTNLPSQYRTSGKKLIREHWRINMDTVPQDNKRMSDLPAQGVLVDTCASWQLADLLTYGGHGTDKVIFILEEASRDVVGVEIPFLRSGRLARMHK